MNNRSYYDVLGVSSIASEKEIKDAARAKLLAYHPDKIKGELTAEQKSEFLLIKEAKDVLQDSKKRKKYDDSLEQSAGVGTELSNFLKMDEEQKKEYLIGLSEEKFHDLNDQLVKAIMHDKIDDKTARRSATSAFAYVKECYDCAHEFVDMKGDERRQLLSEFDDSKHLKDFEIIFEKVVAPMMDKSRVEIAKMNINGEEKQGLIDDIKKTETKFRTEIKDQISKFELSENDNSNSMRRSGMR